MQRILLKNKKNKQNKKLHNRKKIKQKIIIRLKIHNIVKKLHNKTANYLCRSHNEIILSEFEIQQMVEKHKTTKEELNMSDKKLKLININITVIIHI